jgi:predicted ATPase/DNA-binding CsgD family transcriptional regulator
LPAQLTSFVGRESERAEIGQLLRESTRLVTLTGAGGVGKTRLALEVASDLVFDVADGVWLVELAPLFDARSVLPTIATSLGIHEEPGQDLVDTLSAALRFRHLLLVLDNCEHLIDACAEIAHHLLSTSRRLTLLATSREPLGVTGETVWRVASLEQPVSERLFVDRTAAAVRGFAVTGATHGKVAHICRRLDGIPLALELAAARVPALGLEQIATRLDDRFRLLVGGSRTAPRRQQTLRAVVEWSYELLSNDERRLFESLAVFAGGWSLEAAESICRGDVDVLARLVDKSLVSVEDKPSGTWYRMLETVRAYAAEKLRASNTERELRDRHLNWYTALAEHGEHVMRRATDVSWTQRVDYVYRLRQEMDNLRAAWRWSLDGDEVQTGLRMAAALFPYFYSQGYLAEGREWLGALLERTAGSPPTPARVAALSAASKLAAHHGDDATAVRLADEYQSLPEDMQAIKPSMDIHTGLSLCALRRGDASSARGHAKRSYELSRQIGDLVNACMALSYLGAVELHESALDKAAAVYKEALDEARRVDFLLGAALALDGLASVARARCDPASARRLYREALTFFEETGALLQAGQAQIGLGYAALDEREYADAARQFGHAAEVLSGVGQRQLLSVALEGLALATNAQAEQQSTHARADDRVLTERELQVARLLARGLTNREIANELVISVRTADRHVENILGKLGFRSRATVAAWAAQHLLLE